MTDDRPTIDRLVQAVAEALLSVDLTAIPDGATVESEARELAEVAVAALVPLIRAQVEYDDLLAERAGLSRHLEDSQAEVARLRKRADLAWQHYDEQVAENAAVTAERNALAERIADAEADLRLATEQGDRYLAESKAASRERWDAVAERNALGLL